MYVVNLRINNINYLCEANATINEEGNETLDSATIVVKGIYSIVTNGVTKWYQKGIAEEKAKLDLQPYDKVGLTVHEGSTLVYNKTFLIDTWQETITKQATDNSNAVYNYSISLMSETKLLEGIVCPNLVITNDNRTTPLSIYDYINRYFQLYGASHGLTMASNTVWSNLGFTAACPNLSWNEPTLREVLNDLCLLKDCLITLRDGVLTPMSIGQRGSDFTSDNIIYIFKSQSSNNYASETHTTLNNAIDKNDTTNIKYQSYKNDEVAYFSETTNGIHIKTGRPIIELKSLKVNLLVTKVENGGE